MNKIVLSKKQSKEIAISIYDGIKSHVDSNLKRFILCFLEERNKSKGQYIEPLKLWFYPCTYLSNYSSDIEKSSISNKSENGKQNI